MKIEIRLLLSMVCASFKNGWSELKSDTVRSILKLRTLFSSLMMLVLYVISEYFRKSR